MRDHKIFENREHFQKHAEQPTNFSAFQIQEYLKASQFRCAASPAMQPLDSSQTDLAGQTSVHGCAVGGRWRA